VIPEPVRDAKTPPEDVVDVVFKKGPKGAADIWHTDGSFMAVPPMGTVLQAAQLPSVGGDTCWASMSAAYDALSTPMQRFLEGLTAVHSMLPVLNRAGPEYKSYIEFAAQNHGVDHIHPVVKVHPETGRKLIYVNAAWTTHILEVTPAESAKILSLLFEHVKSPEFCMRHRWQVNDVAIWDNRALQHYAVSDYNEERAMRRVVISRFGSDGLLLPHNNNRLRGSPVQ
jgi:alpha-ketoglutarate-dependent taurine dioxygenase